MEVQVRLISLFLKVGRTSLVKAADETCNLGISLGSIA